MTGQFNQPSEMTIPNAHSLWPGTADLGGWRSPQASAGTPNNTRELAQIDKKKPQLITVGASVLVEAAGIEPASAVPRPPDLHA